MEHSVTRYMSQSPHSIGAEQSLAEASKRMKEHSIRHLPVLHGGELVGVLSERDIALVRALGRTDLEEITVEEAMATDAYVVRPTTSLSEVVGTMAERKYSCAVVMDGKRIAGMLTTNDALRILHDRLVAHEAPVEELSPSQIRHRILAEHGRLRRMLIDVDSLAQAVLDGNAGAADLLRRRTGELYRSLTTHIDLEDRILAPALRETTGFGELREQQLLDHHQEQRRTLADALKRLEEGSDPAAELAQRVRELVADIRVDMAHEDKDLLNPDLLKDDLVNVSFGG